MKIIKGLTALIIVFAISMIVASNIIAEEKKEMQSQPEYVLLTQSEIKWVEGPASLPPGSKVAVLEGDPKQAGLVTMRLKFPPHYKLAPHTHPADERVTVISGTLYFGLGEKIEPAKSYMLPEGSFFVAPMGKPMYAYTKGRGAGIQLNIMGPWGLTFLTPPLEEKLAGKPKEK